MALTDSTTYRRRARVPGIPDPSHAGARRAEAIIASAGEAILTEALDGTIETWNPAAQRLYGYSASDIVGESVARLRPDGDLDEAIRERRPVRQGATVVLEAQEHGRDGGVLEVAITRSALRADAGNVMGVVSVVRDVSESRRSAQRLAESESRFAAAFEAAPTGMALTALDGRFLAVNPALCRFLARDAETLLASSVQAVTHPDDLAADLQQGDRATAGEIDSFQQAKRYVLPTGGIVWGLLTITLARDADGKPRHYVSQVQDITDQRTSQAELRRYAAQLQALSEQDPLTGMLNQRAFEVALDKQLRVGVRAGKCNVLLARIDGDDATITLAAQSLKRASRDVGLAAYLGGGEVAVLLPGADSPAAAAGIERISDALPQEVRSAHASARRGETATALLERVRQALPGDDSSPLGARRRLPPEGIGRLLELTRTQLDMPVAFLTRLQGDSYVLVRLAGDPAVLGISEGDTLALVGSHCQMLLDGRMPTTVGDLAANPVTNALDLTRRFGLRAYAGVPVRLRCGDVYGTLSAVDTRPHTELGERQAELLGFLSELAAQLIEDETDKPEAQRAQAGATGVRTLLVALQARDFYTSAHSQQVVEFASAVARRLGLAQDAIRDIEQVALLHDIGKVGIPDAILQKQGPLDDQEWELMRQHPIVGEHIIAGTPGLSHLAPAIRAEHEHWDGGGYPDGLSGDQIPQASRITLACDALHAMTSDRPYRPARTLQRAQQELQACAGTQFDPQVITALLAEIAEQIA
jgi:PAS domain S-box-containing protein